MSRTALYRHFDAEGDLLYVGISANPMRRLSEHHSKSLWFQEIATITVEWIYGDVEASQIEREAISAGSPRYNEQSNTAALNRHLETLSDDVRGEGISFGAWLKSKGIKQSHAAVTLNQSRSYICEICNGTKSPSLRLGVLIEDFTGGEVSIRDLADFYDAEQARRSERVAA